MLIRNVGLSAFLLLVVLVASACKKDKEEPVPETPEAAQGGGSNEQEGEPTPGESKVLFWSRLRMVQMYNFYLEIDGRSVLYDEYYGSNGAGPQSCNSSIGHSFTVDPGTYSYLLRNNLMGISMNGTVTVGQDQCRIIEFVEPSGMWGKGKLLVYARNIFGDEMEFTYTGNTHTHQLTQSFTSAPQPFTSGAFTRYVSPGTYTLRFYDGNGLNNENLIDILSIDVNAGQQTTIRVDEY